MKQKRTLFIALTLLFCLFAGNVYAQRVVKILAIGNSFSEDAVEQNLHQLAAAEGFQTIIGNLYIGGCSLERHVRNAQDNLPAYAYRKIGLDGRKVNTPNTTLADALADEEWDYVSLQQVSGLSGQFDSFEASLPELVDYVKARLPRRTKLMLHQTWAYAANSTHADFPRYHSDQQEMYQAIMKAVKKAARMERIKIVIPSGTAIQNARTSTLGDHLTRDGYHLDLAVGRYTAACAWFEKIFKRKVVGNTYCPSTVTPEQKAIAQRAAHEAVRHPWRVTNLAGVR
ncbi:MAG: DUF4886 domain-containing protein [Mediterranea sp.]|jgi:hypothetical protein|nr:DUF4886 domain-containing protein [Mediterranea sp.]